MMPEEIQAAIARLSRTAARLIQFEAEQPRQRAEAETAAEKLGRMAGRTVADIKKRVREP
jgi:hypothetical protein